MIVPPLYRRDVTELATPRSTNFWAAMCAANSSSVATFGAMCTVAFEVLSRTLGMQYPLILGGVAAVIYVLPYFGLAVILVAAVLPRLILTSPQPSGVRRRRFGVRRW